MHHKATKSGPKKAGLACPATRFNTRKESFQTCGTIFTDQKPVNQTTYAADSPHLDTLAQLDQNTKQAFSKKTFEKRARAKYVSGNVVEKLSYVRSPLTDSYKQTARCSACLSEANGKLTGLYCNQRWCLVCARIRTAKLIHGYLPALAAMPDKYFLTLTVPNVPGPQLKPTVQRMTKEASRIVRNIRRKGTRDRIPFNSLRKLECTHNVRRRDFHPHFHFILDSEAAGLRILEEWLAAWPAATRSAQDLRPATDDSVKELFKYFTKISSKIGPDGKDYQIDVVALDTIFRAIKGQRTFQPTGIIRAVSEEIDEVQAELTGRDLVACWSWMGTDWIDKETGELLTGYAPSVAIQGIAAHIVAPASAEEFGALPGTDFTQRAGAGLSFDSDTLPVPVDVAHEQLPRAPSWMAPAPGLEHLSPNP